MDQQHFDFFLPSPPPVPKSSLIKQIKVVTLREVRTQYNPLTQPEQLVEFWRNEIETASWFDADKEHLVVFCLDTKLRLKGFALVSVGLINQTLIHAREVFRPAIVLAASYVALLHNHPSGDPRPSEDDIRASKEIYRSGEILGVHLVDSIIVGQTTKDSKGYVSLKEMGVIE